MKKIMLIDDDATTNYLNKLIIEKSGMVDEVLVYTSADSALSFFSKGGDLTNGFVILLDVNMPVVNGWEFLSLFKDLSPRPENHIVMLTSSINPYDREKAESNPLVSEYRSKPLSVDVIKELVVSYF